MSDAHKAIPCHAKRGSTPKKVRMFPMSQHQEASMRILVVSCLLLAALLVSPPSHAQSCVSDCGCPPGQICQEDHAGGHCEIAFCPEDYRPVCGFNGMTYSNACRASVARVKVAHDGPCESPSALCDGLAGMPCPDGLFCDHDPGQCHVADVAGMCHKVPKTADCPEVFKPVCGCDGRSYDNDCLRRAARVSFDHQGKCEDGDGPMDNKMAGCDCCYATVVSEKGQVLWTTDPIFDTAARTGQGQYRLRWKSAVADDAIFVQPFAPTDDFPRSLVGWPARISDDTLSVTTDAHYVGSGGGHTHRESLDVRFSLLRCPSGDMHADPQ